MRESFKPVLFALNNDPKSYEPMIKFLVEQGLEYVGNINKDKYGFSRNHLFKNGDFELQISWVRNVSTVEVAPNGYKGFFTEVRWDEIREAMVEYTGHKTLAFCYGGHQMLLLAIPREVKE